jgi:hypothetical protein
MQGFVNNISKALALCSKKSFIYHWISMIYAFFSRPFYVENQMLGMNVKKNKCSINNKTLIKFLDESNLRIVERNQEYPVHHTNCICIFWFVFQRIPFGTICEFFPVRIPFIHILEFQHIH